MTTVRDATDPQQLAEVRKLMHAFIDWHHERHREHAALIDSYFDPVEFEVELNNLPGEFAPPRGRLLIATHEGRPAGCVALRDLGGGACEMKRMFVYDEFHGKGVGRALVESVLGAARKIGYGVMRLDTGPLQIEAQTLYRSVGFEPVAPYYELPQALRDWLVFMELDLGSP